MTLGPLMIDLVAEDISEEERAMLQADEVGGVILFTRNFRSVGQLTELVAEIHAIRSPRLLVAVDHEGGRVQRFRQGFTHLPPAAVYEQVYRDDAEQGRHLAQTAGWLMASELLAVGVDFSFAPVLDLAHGVSGVIGDRAFARKPETVATLAYAFMHGMQRAGMQAVGKHFPGHGAVVEDSHVAMPVDHRKLTLIMEHDVEPFRRMIENGLTGIMPAHVVYDQVDPRPAGYSAYWLGTVLRQQLGFNGVIFSDDLSMEAAGVAGDFTGRARLALQAGCDMALICNHPEQAAKVIDGLRGYNNPTSQVRLIRMHGKPAMAWQALRQSEAWRTARETLRPWLESPVTEMEV